MRRVLEPDQALVRRIESGEPLGGKLGGDVDVVPSQQQDNRDAQVIQRRHGVVQDGGHQPRHRDILRLPDVDDVLIGVVR
ncbi:hypothetical protein D3C72_2100510 [compost metagenome]